MPKLFKLKPAPLFAPGQICYPDEIQVLLRQADVPGVVLVCRHLAGDWGEVDEKRRWVNRWVIANPQDERKLPIISRFTLPGGQQVAIFTQHVHEPAKRKTTLSLWPPVIKKPLAEDGMEQLPQQKRAGKKKRRRQEARVPCGPTKS